MGLFTGVAAERATEFARVVGAACDRDNLFPKGVTDNVFAFEVPAAGRSYSVRYLRSGAFLTICASAVPAGMMDGLDIDSLNRRIAPNRIAPQGPFEGNYGFALIEPFPLADIGGSLRAILRAKAENAATFDAAMREMGF